MDKDSVVKMIKSCLLSTKGKITLRQLERDYSTIIGSRIPYAQFGYKKLEDLIKSEPCFLISYSSSGEIYVDATSEKASHISEMVNKQKTTKKSAPRAKRLKKVTFHDTRHSNGNHNVQPEKWRPKVLNKNQNKQFQSSQRPAAVRHNQFVNYGTMPSVVPSKVVVPETSALHSSNNKIVKNKKTTDINERLVVTSNDQTKPVNLTVTVKNNDAQEKCSSLISTKKRISKKMSELSLDRDSGNSSPTSEFSQVINTKTPEFTRTDDPIVDIKNFVRIFKLGEIEVSINRVAKEGFYTCNLKVGKKTFYSYPKEFRDSISAQKYCSEIALQELISKHGEKKSLLLSSDKDILERIPPMLEKHSNCLWVSQLELDYTDKFHEQLPVDWLKIIDSSPCIQVEKLLDNYVIKHCKPGEALQKGLKWNTRLNIADVSIPSNTVQFGEDNRLIAEVTYVVSANEIWCRQLGTHERALYDAMIEKMDAFYNLNYATMHVNSITESGYYVAYYEEAWYRIRAVAINETDVHCFFIDYGDETVIQINNIFKLQREFASSQAQAFVCRLIGLEELYEASVGSEILQKVVEDKQLILEQDPSYIVSDDLSIPVYMYDSTDGRSINYQIIPLLTMESASPDLPKDTISEVVISNIEDNGDIYVQIHSPGYHSLCEQMADLEKEINEKPPTELLTQITKLNSHNKTYLAKYKPDNHWRRVNIIDWSPKEDMAQIYFVDYGNTDVIVINQDQLYPLDKLSDILNQYPHQAIKVHIDFENIPKNFKELCLQELPLNTKVLLKIIKYTDKVPWVEFFKRNADGGLFCVNKSIELKEKLKEDSNNNIKNIKRKFILSQFDGLNKNVPSGGFLQRPALPSQNGYFEVHIPFAVNPWNFFIQPLATQRDLHKLMLKLQETYKDKLYSPLQKDDIIPGKIYASKHDDGNWYRTSVIKVIHAGSISVFYCDFGYYGNLTVQQLIPLEPEFMELPYQALKAKLTDIKPKQDKWTVDDCEAFKELVEGKSFVSILIDVEKDELYESDIVLNLYLVDTTTELDIYIGKELIKKGIAVKV